MNKLIPFIAFSFVTLSALTTPAQNNSNSNPKPPAWTLETHNKCKVWDELPFDMPISSNYKLWWSGECKNGFASGSGYLQWGIPDRNDPVNIPPLVVAHNDGPIVDGKLNGKGKLSLSDSYTYTGDFVDGQADGYGTETYPSGNRFVGLYSHGDRNGHGTWNFNNGDKMQCEYKNDKMPDGFIVYDWADGDHFEGYWVDNEASGHGFYIDKTGKHEGEWINGVLTTDSMTYTVREIHKAPR